MKAKHYWNTMFLAALCCHLFCLQSIAQSPLAVNYSDNNNPINKFSDQEILDQLRSLPDPLVAPHLDAVVASYIKTYTVKNRERTENMLGKMDFYFPIFEKYLHEAGLPGALKYVPVLESALDPMATSRSGAAGLWQIMPITAKDLDLRVSRYVDDRRDLERSTKAAVAYLKKLYKRFGSWELALAAYNGGPGRVSRVIRRTGIKDFWKLRKHLPRETRNYVSAFLGANYISNYYYQYNLSPRYRDQRYHATQTLQVTQTVRFSELAEISGADKEMIQLLNSRYPRGYIPEKSSGYPIKLPALEAALLVNQHGLINYLPAIPGGHRQLNYEVQATDNFIKICNDLKCHPADVVRWNGLNDLKLEPGNYITYFKPIVKPPARKKYTELPEVSSRLMLNVFPEKELEVDIIPTINTADLSIKKTSKDYRRIVRKIGKQKIYVVQSGDSLLSITKKLDDLDLSELMNINNLQSTSRIYPGQHLLIK